jgi:RNA polymerase sigma-70 factor (ECF subfamily)
LHLPQPRVRVVRIKTRMGADVQQLLLERRYDEALEVMLELYEQKVFRMAVAMLRDTGRAEEVTQDIFLKMWRAFPKYDGHGLPSTWLYAIARNTCLSVVRSESYRKTSALDEVPEPAAALSSLPVDWHRLLARLPDAQRHAITLYYFEERSITEVAAMMGVPEGTLKSQLHRARRALADMME